MKKFVVWTAIIVGVVLALGSLGVVVGWFGTGYGQSSADANKQWAEWKRIGLAATQADLHPNPIKPEENAFEDLRLLRIEFFGGEMKSQPLPLNISSGSGWADGSIHRYLLKRQGGLDKLAAILEKKRDYRSNHDWDEGADILFPEFAQYKTWSRLLCLDAERRAMDGDLAGALARLRSARQLARLTTLENIIIADLVAISQEKILTDSINQIASKHSDDIEFLRKVRSMLRETTWTVDSAASLRKEAYMQLAIYRQVPKEYVGRLNESEPFGSEETRKNPIRDGLPQNQVSRAVWTEAMRFYNEFYPRVLKDPNDLSIIADADRTLTRMQTSGSLPQQDALLLLVAPGFVRSGRTLLSCQRTMDAYLAALIHHATHKKWPADLAEAGINRPDAIDPITGSPLGYRVKNNEMRLWNSGQNRLDDGGVTPEEAKAASSGSDFVLAYPYRK